MFNDIDLKIFLFEVLKRLLRTSYFFHLKFNKFYYLMIDLFIYVICAWINKSIIDGLLRQKKKIVFLFRLSMLNFNV